MVPSIAVGSGGHGSGGDVEGWCGVSFVDAGSEVPMGHRGEGIQEQLGICMRAQGSGYSFYTCIFGRHSLISKALFKQ